MGRNFGIGAWLASNQRWGRWSFLSNNKRHHRVRSFSDFPHSSFQRKHFLPMTNATLAKLAASVGNRAWTPGWLVESGGFMTVGRLNNERQMRLGPQPLTCRHRVFRWWAILLSHHLSVCCRDPQWEIACCLENRTLFDYSLNKISIQLLSSALSNFSKRTKNKRLAGNKTYRQVHKRE